jgi:hypothetical protein
MVSEVAQSSKRGTSGLWAWMRSTGVPLKVVWTMVE